MTEKKLLDRYLHRIADCATLGDREMTVHFQVKLDEGSVARIAGPQVVEITHVREDNS